MTSLSAFVGDEVDQSSYGLELDPQPQAKVEPPQVQPQAIVTEPATVAGLEIECLCPFCGSFNSAVGKPCENCKQEDTVTTRAATARKMGPWYVLQPNNPDAPGLNFDELVSLIRNQTVTSRSVVRGATTGQLWRLASKVRGLSREFGQCYSCGGDIENDETVCPHCDRRQTVQEHTDAIPQPVALPLEDDELAVHELAEEPQSPKEVRKALLPEPIIHVHSLSKPDHEPVDPIRAARPVVAECAERHYPKDDLLTPREVAKAFSLEFGTDEIDRFLAKPNHTIKRMKIALTSTAALSLAAVVLWPMTRIVSDWINAPASHAMVTPTPAPMNTVTDPHSTSEIAYADPERPVFPTQVVASAPIVAGAVMTPANQPEPIPTASPADDPKLLWSSALEAESTRNFKAAVDAYERIESLPSDSWPTNLETRLTLARKELKGDVR